MSAAARSKRGKVLAVAAAVAAVAAIIALFVWRQYTGRPEVALTAVVSGPMTQSFTTVGDIEARTRNVITLTPSSKVVDVRVREGDTVKKGDLLVVLDTTDSQRQLKEQTIALADAEATLAYLSGASSARDAASARNAVSQSEIALGKAQADYVAAQGTLMDVQSFNDNALDQAQLAVDSAELAYDAASDTLESAEALAEVSVEQARIALAGAEDACDLAKKNLEALKASLARGEITQAEYNIRHPALKSEVVVAENAVRAAEASLAEAEASAEAKIAVATAEVSDAENAVENAELSLAEAQTRASADSDAARKAVSDAARNVRSAEVVLADAQSAARYSTATSGETISNQKDRIALVQANIDYLRGKIEEGNLRANVDGVVAKMDAVENEFPEAGDRILVDGTVEYVASVDASQYDSANVRAGQRAEVTLKDIGRQYNGMVSEVGQLAEVSLTSTDQDPKVTIKVSILNPDTYVKVGYEADTEIFVAEKAATLQISFEAVATDAGTGRRYVYTVDDSNTATRTYIETGIETDEYVEVLGGLSEGQLCIVNPDGSISDGTKVRRS